MRNAIIIPFSGEESLVIASDNSGAIGMKEGDAIQVPYETVGYYSFRVAVMECMASGAEPISIVIQNFCGNEAWSPIVEGIQKGLAELEMGHVPITGSTESNFSLAQSAVGINVIGKRSNKNDRLLDLENKNVGVGLIGLPLVGNEVVVQVDEVAPLLVFKEICLLDEVNVWPVGSKGILHELHCLYPEVKKESLPIELDVMKSGGPATCFLVVYMESQEKAIKNIAGEYFRQIIDFNHLGC